jgi:putative transposase
MGRRLKINGIGRVRIRWHRPIECKIKTIRIRRQAGEWYACFVCKIQEQALAPTGKSIGINVGIHHLLATTENEIVENPRWYRAE